MPAETKLDIQENADGAVRKRDAWAVQPDVDVYIDRMGRYAVKRDEGLVRELLGSGEGRLLDLPCGTGRFLQAGTDLGYQVTAADYSPAMMSVATRFEGVEFVRADAFDPPFENEAFDAILTMRLLFHYAEPEKIIGALARTLRPGGRMVFDTLNPGSSRWLASQVVHRLNRSPAKRLYFADPMRLASHLDSLGLTVERRVGVYLLPTRSYRLLPDSLTRAVHAIEQRARFLPRVLNYWQVSKRG